VVPESIGTDEKMLAAVPGDTMGFEEEVDHCAKKMQAMGSRSCKLPFLACKNRIGGV